MFLIMALSIIAMDLTAQHKISVVNHLYADTLTSRGDTLFIDSGILKLDTLKIKKIYPKNGQDSIRLVGKLVVDTLAASKMRSDTSLVGSGLSIGASDGRRGTAYIYGTQMWGATGVTIDSQAASGSSSRDIYLTGSSHKIAGGQSFYVAHGGSLDSCKFYLKKTGSPTGLAWVRLYARTTSGGYDLPVTGGVLDTLSISDSLNVATLTTSLVLKTFKFTNSTRKYTLSDTTHYVISVSYLGGDDANYVSYSYVYPAGAAGNEAYCASTDSTWTATTADMVFYVYGNITAKNSYVALSSNPTLNRTIALPDASGTVLLNGATFLGIAQDSVGLSRGTPWLKVSDGTFHWKY